MWKAGGGGVKGGTVLFVSENNFLSFSRMSLLTKLLGRKGCANLNYDSETLRDRCRQQGIEEISEPLLWEFFLCRKENHHRSPCTTHSVCFFFFLKSIDRISS